MDSKIPFIKDCDLHNDNERLEYEANLNLFFIKNLIQYTNESISKTNYNLREEMIALEDKHLKIDKVDEMCVMNMMRPYAYRSYVLVLYSIVESILDDYCISCEKKYNLKISLNDLKDKGITRSVTYLQKVVQIDAIKCDNRWNKMLTVDYMRNDIIHNGGKAKNQNHIKNYLEHFNVEIDDETKVIDVTYENIITIYELCKNYIHFVLSQKTSLDSNKG